MAWLHATPKPPAGTKRAENVDTTKLRSRLDERKARGIPIEMPPNPMPHMIDRLVEIGLSEAAGMGSGPISWREINEWQHSTKVKLSPWEARQIRSMSVAYVAMSRTAESETCPPPWRTQVSEPEKAAEIADLESLLG